MVTSWYPRAIMIHGTPGDNTNNSNYLHPHIASDTLILPVNSRNSTTFTQHADYIGAPKITCLCKYKLANGGPERGPRGGTPSNP